MLNYLLVSLRFVHFLFLYVSIRRYAAQSDFHVTVCPIAKERKGEKKKKKKKKKKGKKKKKKKKEKIKLFYSPFPIGAIF